MDLGRIVELGSMIAAVPVADGKRPLREVGARAAACWLVDEERR
jgi:hypothetical protein